LIPCISQDDKCLFVGALACLLYGGLLGHLRVAVPCDGRINPGSSPPNWIDPRFVGVYLVHKDNKRSMKNVKQYRLAVVIPSNNTLIITIHHVLSYSLKEALSINKNAIALSWEPVKGVEL